MTRVSIGVLAVGISIAVADISLYCSDKNFTGEAGRNDPIVEIVGNSCPNEVQKLVEDMEKIIRPDRIYINSTLLCNPDAEENPR
jgi:hypothetical protein